MLHRPCFTVPPAPPPLSPLLQAPSPRTTCSPSLASTASLSAQAPMAASTRSQASCFPGWCPQHACAHHGALPLPTGEVLPGWCPQYKLMDYSGVDSLISPGVSLVAIVSECMLIASLIRCGFAHLSGRLSCCDPLVQRHPVRQALRLRQVVHLPSVRRELLEPPLSHPPLNHPH